jgi:hypothetical protein
MADIQGIRHYATDVVGYADPYYASFNVTVDMGDAGAVMTIVSLYDMASLASGEAGDGYGVGVVGCAGQNPGEWDFDAGADEVEWDVEQSPSNPNEYTVTYSAGIPDYRAAAYEYDAYGYPIYDDAEIPRTVISGEIHFVLPELDASTYDDPYGYGEPVSY